MKRKRQFRIIAFLAFAVLIAFAANWLFSSYKPADEAVAVFNSSNVEVSLDKYITFTPKNKTPDTALIFYPGGKVEPEAYAPLCSKIAAQGFMVIIPSMPLNLAVLSPEKADEVIKAYPSIKNWAVGGHSLGGVMAASFAKKHLNEVKALALFASYPQNKDDLSSAELKVLSVWGSEDGCADIGKIKAAENILPKTSVFKEISGGNHAQFGSYGFQKGDKEAKISSLEQQSLAVQYTVNLLSEISK
ncbi:alpha/beta hydrolase [Clostridium swellfunianum]|uniref:alpha/beta hydrolase n=1 Tax=Clostridium swellfunianum TaxID=1367462 RepID=UPI00202EB6B9|nr:alpha/beta hydrolase [Clostridium swellfunianum]MCM0647383.1 alpha/beta hydrolase [Clostridium swellfunianum]